MGDNKKVVATIGLSGFPEGMAASQKLLMMGKATIMGGKSFWVISNSFIRKKPLNQKLKKIGHVEGIIYLTTSPYVFSPKSKISKLKGKLVGYCKEFFLIRKLLNEKRLEAVIIYSPKFLYTLFWGLYLKIRKCNSYLIYFELRSQIEQRNSSKLKINDYFMDKYSFCFTNGVITISEYLIQHIKKYSPNKPYLNVPPIVDFDDYANKDLLVNDKEKYFLFCGSVGYIEIIEFILRSFKKVLSKFPEFKLKLVVNGSSEKFDRLNKLILEIGIKNEVKIYSGLTKIQLITKYLNAFALLIPLRNNIQDTARFPHKIAEYCASKRPFISCKVGEIESYFDDTTAFLSNTYSIDEYAEEMIKTIENPIDRESRAQKAYELGQKYFDYRGYSSSLIKFIENPESYNQTV